LPNNLDDMFKSFRGHTEFRASDIERDTYPHVRVTQSGINHQQDTIDHDHWVTDPFACIAPSVSDLEAAVLPQSNPGRSIVREVVKEKANEYHDVFEGRNRRTQITAMTRIAVIPVDLALGGAITASNVAAGAALQSGTVVGFHHQRHIAEALGATAFAISGGHEAGARVIERGPITDCLQGAAVFRHDADRYPTVAEFGRADRDRFAPELRRLLGEAGRSTYESACTATDQAMPRYLRELARVNDDNVVHHTMGGDARIPTFGFRATRDFRHAGRRTNLYDCSKELLAPTIREFAHLVVAHNEHFRIVDETARIAAENAIETEAYGRNVAMTLPQRSQARGRPQRSFGMSDLAIANFETEQARVRLEGLLSRSVATHATEGIGAPRDNEASTSGTNRFPGRGRRLNE